MEMMVFRSRSESTGNGVGKHQNNGKIVSGEIMVLNVLTRKKSTTDYISPRIGIYQSDVVASSEGYNVDQISSLMSRMRDKGLIRVQSTNNCGDRLFSVTNKGRGLIGEYRDQHE
jgi:hypothetical protein